MDAVLLVGALLLAGPAQPPTAAPLAAPPLQRSKKKAKVEPAEELRPFLGDLAEARASARERNVPVAIFLALEGEEASDRFRDQVLPDREVARVCRDAIAIFSNNGLHEPVTVEETVDGRKVERQECRFYRTPTCTDHQKTWDPIYFEFQVDGELRAPQVIVLGPDGKLLERIDTGEVPPVGDVVAAIQAAQKKFGPGATAEQVARMKEKIDLVRRHAFASDWPGAWRGWAEILAISDRGAYADEARKGIEDARKGVEARIAAARELLVPGSATQGYQRLADLHAETAGLPIQSDVAKRMDEAARDKAIRAEIEAYKLELEAEALWKEAEALVAAKEDKKAERTIRKLLRAKYAPTAAAARARKAHPDWAAEEAGG